MPNIEMDKQEALPLKNAKPRIKTLIQIMIQGVSIVSSVSFYSCATAPKCNGPKEVVDLVFRINESGAVYDIKLVKSANRSLDSSAVEAAAMMKFKPEKMAEIQVGQLMKRRFEFQECTEKKR